MATDIASVAEELLRLILARAATYSRRCQGNYRCDEGKRAGERFASEREQETRAAMRPQLFHAFGDLGFERGFDAGAGFFEVRA